MRAARSLPAGLLTVALAAAAAASAEEPAAEAWGLFAAVCPPIAADFTTARAVVAAAGGELQAAASADGAIVKGNVSFPGRTIGRVEHVAINYGRERQAGGSASWCMLQLVGAGGGELVPGLDAAVAAGAPGVLGGAVETYGGALAGFGPAAGSVTVHHLPGFPPPASVRFMAFDRVATVQITRLDAGKE